MSSLTKLLAFLLLPFLISCASEKVRETNKLVRFLEIFSYNYEEVSAVLVLTEEGCPTCNRSFASLIENYIDDPKAVCVVSAKGNRIDLSSFINSDRVIIDMDNTFGELQLTEGTASIFLAPSGLIDTVVKIKAQTLEQDLNYISKRLEED